MSRQVWLVLDGSHVLASAVQVVEAQDEGGSLLHLKGGGSLYVQAAPAHVLAQLRSAQETP